MRDLPHHLFFSGIGGSGMSALAVFMAGRGKKVAGSDRSFAARPDAPLAGTLRSAGIRLVPQDGSGIDDSIDLAVFSTAVEPDNPEAVAARARGIPATTRPAFLADIAARLRTTAVAGTSGKSTVAGMLAFVMHRIGLAPNFIGGGRVKQFASQSNPGNALSGGSDLLVIEACESDGTIVDYRPEQAVLLNLDLDHHPVGDTAGLFRTFVGNTRGSIVFNGDDRRLRELVPPHAVPFSLDAPSPYRPERVRYEAFGAHFMLKGTPFHLRLPGRYNLSNALACIAALGEAGIPVRDTAPALAEFTGIDRRFDVHLNDGTFLVIDDYAHNPHKIAALMRTLRGASDRICYLFQPHGFAPTRMMKEEYIEAFADGLREGDHLVLLPIYYAGGTAARDISSHDLAGGIAARGGSVEVIADRTRASDRAGQWNTVAVMGARDETLSEFAASVARALASRKTDAIPCRKSK